jgi:hypothetical protein
MNKMIIAVIQFVLLMGVTSSNADCIDGTNPKTCYKKGDIIESRSGTCGPSCPELRVTINGDCTGSTCIAHTFSELHPSGDTAHVWQSTEYNNHN